MHQVAQLPHEGLVPIDDRLRLVAIFVEARLRHRGLDLFHQLLAFGNPRFEIGDFRLQLFGLLVAAAQNRLFAFSLLVCDSRVIFFQCSRGLRLRSGLRKLLRRDRPCRTRRT